MLERGLHGGPRLLSRSERVRAGVQAVIYQDLSDQRRERSSTEKSVRVSEAPAKTINFSTIRRLKGGEEGCTYLRMKGDTASASKRSGGWKGEGKYPLKGSI